ncbi:MAG: phosphatidate cytidylyltransferase [Phycisphaerae bacterium]|nr:phosphatidate cytidylyltransferase [Phycisphaerae bacterium]
MVRTRVFFGTLLIVAVLGLVALDAWLTQQTIPEWRWLAGGRLRTAIDYLPLGALMTVVLAVMISWGVLEMGRLCRAAGFRPAVGWACLATFVMVVLPWVSITPALGNRASMGGWELTGQWLAGTVGVAAIWIMLRGDPKGAIGDIAVTTWLIAYLGFLGSFESRLRIDMGGPIGAWLVLYHIAVVKFADIGAYFTGITLGRHKIVPKLSPNKTLEGYIGGMVLAVVVAVAMSKLGGIIMPWYKTTSPGPWLTTGQAVAFGICMGLVGQVGDLIESLIKRDAAIKDSGSLIPSFGGVLDLIDSPLLTAPLAWWLLTNWVG